MPDTTALKNGVAPSIAISKAKGVVKSQPLRKGLLATLIIAQLFTLTACSSFLAATRSGPIVDDYSKRSLGNRIDDSWIETRCEVNLKKAGKDLKKSNIDVTSYNGVVLLAGQVANEKLKSRAGEIALAVRGVNRLHNELSISGATSLPARSNDLWLSAKIKTKLITGKGIKSSRVKVVTENGVAYLLGLVTRQQGELVVKRVRSTFGVQKIVMLFEYIAD